MTKEESEEEISKDPTLELIRPEFIGTGYGVQFSNGKKAFSRGMIKSIVQSEERDKLASSGKRTKKQTKG